MSIKYSIVIPTYNHCDDLLKPCIEAIVKYTDLSIIELVVVANGCRDETESYLQYLTEYFKQTDIGAFKWHVDPQPLGYAHANNVGIRMCTADKIVLLNNDAFLLEQPKNQWLELLNHQFEINPKCGISCVVKGRSDEANADFAIFFCVMIARKVFDKIGLLNEEYGKGGGEDTEFSIECERAGFEVCSATSKQWDGVNSLFTGNFQIYHRGEGTVHDKTLVPDWDDVFLANSLKLAKKYNPKFYEKKVLQLQRKNELASLDWLHNQQHDIFGEVITDNHYEIDEQNIFGLNVVDIGANLGMFSIFAAYLGANKIVALEPVAETYSSLVKNITKANFSDVIEPVKKVVSVASGDFVEISVLPESGHNSIYKVQGRAEMVETVRLGDIIKSFDDDRDVYIKMDCEGSEFDIILGATSADFDHVREIVLEIHLNIHPHHNSPAPLYNKLKSLGFTQKFSKQLMVWYHDDQGKETRAETLPMMIEKWVR